MGRIIDWELRRPAVQNPGASAHHRVSSLASTLPAFRFPGSVCYIVAPIVWGSRLPLPTGFFHTLIILHLSPLSGAPVFVLVIGQFPACHCGWQRLRIPYRRVLCCSLLPLGSSDSAALTGCGWIRWDFYFSLRGISVMISQWLYQFTFLLVVEAHLLVWYFLFTPVCACMCVRACAQVQVYVV